MKKRGCAQKERTAQNRSSRQCTKKDRKCYSIYLFKEKMEKLREKYGIRGYIYIYPDVFHAKLTQHLGAFISWKICDGINSHKI